MRARLASTTLVAILFFVQELLCQAWPDHRWDNWYADIGYSFNFSGGTLNPGPFFYSGGSGIHSVLSDPVSGAVLFRTDGHHVYNATGDTMLNGNFIVPAGDELQSLIISAGPNLHYIATLTSVVGTTELRYSEVDMTLDGGSGGVTFNKGIPLADGVSGITAFSSNTGDTTWLLAPSGGTMNVLGFPFDPSGVGPSYIANTGTSFYQAYERAHGKNSRANDKVAFRGGTQKLNLFTCDRPSGMIDGPIVLNMGQSFDSFDFSPDGEHLYVELDHSLPGAPTMVQLDLVPFDSASIMSTIDTIDLYEAGQGAFGGYGMQLTPTNEILFHRLGEVTSPDSAFASRIAFPDVNGNGCGYDPNSVFVGVCPFPGYGFNQVPSLWWPALAPDVSVIESALSPITLALSPNPTDGLTQVTVHGPALPDRWVLHDATGRVACEFGGIGSAMGCLDLSPVAAGVYTLCAWSKGQRLASARVARQ